MLLCYRMCYNIICYITTLQCYSTICINVTAQLEACLCEKTSLEQTLEELTANTHSLSTSLTHAQERLEKYEASHQEFIDKQDDLEQRQRVMENNVGQESKGKKISTFQGKKI